MKQAERIYQMPYPVIALTGGIASGKSTVIDQLRKNQVPCLVADELVKSIYQKDSSKEFIKKEFPACFVEQQIDFKCLRSKVFSQALKRELVENFIYPQMEAEFKAMAPKQASFLVYEIPLLFERGLQSKFDLIACVYTPKELIIQRIITRDGSDRDVIEKILSTQLDIEEKKNKSDYIIDNYGSLEEFKRNIQKFERHLAKSYP